MSECLSLDMYSFLREMIHLQGKQFCHTYFASLLTYGHFWKGENLVPQGAVCIFLNLFLRRYNRHIQTNRNSPKLSALNRWWKIYKFIIFLYVLLLTQCWNDFGFSLIFRYQLFCIKMKTKTRGGTQ